MKRLCLVLVFFIFLTGSALAMDPNFYIGAGYGVSSIDTGVTGLTGTASLDEDDGGFKIFGGFKFNNYFGIELGYADLGSAELKGNTGDTFILNGTTLTFLTNGVNIEAEATTILLEGVVFFPMDVITGNDSLKYFEPFLKVGVHFWDVEYTVAASSLSTVTADDDGTDLVFGAGINFKIIEHLTIRAEWERFDTDDDVDYFSGSLIFNF